MRRYRYKRRSGYRSRVVKMKFQSFVDIGTQADNMQIISINAGGNNVIKRLAPFFSAYKYYKLGNVSIKMIPASTLPVDPTGLSYVEDDFQTVDPRDQLTPGMCRITNGEDILENITGLTGDQQRELYNNMLLDSRWFKWMLQSGVKRIASPRYWQIGQLHQDKWPGAIVNLPRVRTSTAVTDTEFKYVPEAGSAEYASFFAGSDPRGIFQTGHRGKLGWMPTDGLAKMGDLDNTVKELPELCSVPTVELFKVLTPPMHKTNYYYRMFITETVYFKDPLVMNLNGFRPLDMFHYQSTPVPAKPSTPVTGITDQALDQYTGGNDGGY